MKKYDLSKIMKRAWELVKKVGMTISSELKKAWEEAKMVKEIKNVVLKEYMSYNKRRYSKPWVCKMQNGKYNFSEKVGCFSAKDGEEGNLVVFKPVIGQVYGFGQKDYRGNGTEINFCKWNGSCFVECNKVGR